MVLGVPHFEMPFFQETLHLLIGADVVEEMLGETRVSRHQGERAMGDFQVYGRGEPPILPWEVNIWKNDEQCPCFWTHDLLFLW